MDFEIRPLSYSDIAPMTRIISRIGVREFANAMSPESVRAMMGGSEDRAEKVSKVSISLVFELAGIVLANFESVSDDLAKFLGSVSGMTAKEVKALSLADTYDLLQAILSSQDFKDFFTRVMGSLPKREAGESGSESSTGTTQTQ